MPFLIIAIILFGFYRYIQSKKRAKANAKLILLQNYLTGVNYSELNMTQKQLTLIMQQFINRHAKIMTDCESILNSTSSAKTFFGRIETFNKSKEALQGLNEVYPGAVTVRFASDEQMEQLTNEFLQRLWFSSKEKSISAKTEKGKMTALSSFLEIVDLYQNNLTSKNIEYAKIIFDSDTGYKK